MIAALKWIGIGLASFLALLIGSCVLYEWPNKARFEVTMLVDVDGQPRQGSAVWELTDARPGGLRNVATVAAESVCVDAGSRGLLCMTLAHRPARTHGVVSEISAYRLIAESYAPRGQPDPIGWHRSSVEAISNVRRHTAPVAVSRQEWPMMILFRNIDTFETAVIADDDLLSTMTIKIRAIIVAVTTKPVTQNYKKNFPWLVAMMARKKMDGGMSVDGRFSYSSPAALPILSNLKLMHLVRTHSHVYQ